MHFMYQYFALIPIAPLRPETVSIARINPQVFVIEVAVCTALLTAQAGKHVNRTNWLGNYSS